MARSAGAVVEIVKRVVGNYLEHRMGTYAAALAYRGLFALFPFMLLPDKRWALAVESDGADHT